MAKEKQDWDKVHQELERQGKLNEFTTPFRTDNLVNIDGDYVFIEKTRSFKATSVFVRGVMAIFSPLVNFFAFGGIKFKGKQNLKKIKDSGAISISQHFSFLDSLILRQIFAFKKKLYITVAPHNCKTGIKGLFLRAGGILPLTQNIAGYKNFKGAVKEVLDNKGVVQFYAERAMWLDYPKPRPLKKGAFFYAVDNDVPVLPLFYEIKPCNWFFKIFGIKKHVTVHILDPIYCDNSIVNKKQRSEDLHMRCQRAIIDKYRECFGVDKDNIYDIDPEYYDALDYETKLAMSMARDGKTIPVEMPNQVTNSSSKELVEDDNK